MFPIRDDNPTFLRPYATYFIVALNILAWTSIQGLGSEPPLSQSVCALGLLPGELFQLVPVGTAFQIGPNATCQITGSSNWYTMVSHMFLHGSWMHIIGNMWFMWVFGDNVEDSMGHLRFIQFYLLCGFAAAGLQILSNPSSHIPMVGASGAIGGVMCAYVWLYPKVTVHLLLVLGFYITTFALPAIWMLGYWFFVQLIGGFTSFGNTGGVAFWAHVGGFVAGIILIQFFKKDHLVKRHPNYGWRKKSW